MRRWGPINERQLAVLQRVADGDCLDTADAAVRKSARALQDRSLVEISRRGGEYRATLTDAGHFYLKHGCHPDHPDAPSTQSRAETDAIREAANSNSDTDTRSATQIHRPPPHTTARIAAARKVAAQALIAELEKNPQKYVEDADDHTVAEWRKIIDFAKRHNLVPDGHRIEKSHDYGGGLLIKLLPGTHANTRDQVADSPPVAPMPTQLRSLHPVVKRLQDDTGRLVVPPDVRRRSLLFFHGLTQEAVRRGYEVRHKPVDERHTRSYYGYSQLEEPRYTRRDGQIDIVVNGFTYTVTVEQERPNSEVAERTELLIVKLPGHYPGHFPGRASEWKDRKRRTIDDVIGPVLDELAIRAVEDEQHRIDKERAKAERRVKWEAAMARAKRLAVQAHYAKHLDEQAATWQRINLLRDYCEALERRINDAPHDDERLNGARDWLAWARQYTSVADPLKNLPTMPSAPDPKDVDLKPYLGNWSPYGPEAGQSGWR